MATKASEKIIDALTQLMEGFTELQESIERDYDIGADDDDEDDDDADSEKLEAEQALSTEMKAALEALVENEDYAPEEIASLISSLTGALEEIDPNVFADDQSIDEETSYDADDDDLDDLDDDLYDEDDELEDEDEV